MTKPSAQPLPLLDTDGAAALLGLAPRTLMNWRVRGGDHPPFVRIGGAIRYRPEDIQAYIERHRYDNTGKADAADRA